MLKDQVHSFLTYLWNKELNHKPLRKRNLSVELWLIIDRVVRLGYVYVVNDVIRMTPLGKKYMLEVYNADN